MREVKLEGMTVVFDDSQEIKDAVFEAVIGFFVEEESFSGECIMQGYGPMINGPVVLSEIADNIVKFKVSYE